MKELKQWWEEAYPDDIFINEDHEDEGVRKAVYFRRKLREIYGPALIIAGFPGIGKTTFAEGNPRIVDLDSSNFDKGDRWPHNYIKEIFDQEDIVLCSTHKEVLDELEKYDTNIRVFYPYKGDELMYLERLRGHSSFDKIAENWYSFIEDINSSKLKKIRTHRYLSEHEDRIMRIPIKKTVAKLLRNQSNKLHNGDVNFKGYRHNESRTQDGVVDTEIKLEYAEEGRR